MHLIIQNYYYFQPLQYRIDFILKGSIYITFSLRYNTWPCCFIVKKKKKYKKNTKIQPTPWCVVESLFWKITGSILTALHKPEVDDGTTTRQGSPKRSLSLSLCLSDGAFLGLYFVHCPSTGSRNRQRVSSDILNCLVFRVTQFNPASNRIRVVWLGANFSACTCVAGGTGPPNQNESKPRMTHTPQGYIKGLYECRVHSYQP